MSVIVFIKKNCKIDEIFLIFYYFLIVFKVINIVVWMVRVVVLFVMGLIGFYYKIFKYYENMILKIIMLDIVYKVWDWKI